MYLAHRCTIDAWCTLAENHRAPTHRLKAQSAAQEVVVQEQPQAGEEEEEEEEESSEYETDSEEEGHLLMKPVFVPKTDREVCRARVGVGAC